MGFEEKYKKDPEHYNKKIFGKQKVKLKIRIKTFNTLYCVFLYNE